MSSGRVPAPIALFVYNRPAHTRRTVEALQVNQLAAQSDLTVYSDAPKTAASAADVAAVRAYVRRITGFKSVRVVEREANRGLAASIIEGVTDISNRYGRVIVLEDDLVTAKSFLCFMNDGLDRYADSADVASVHGYWYPLRDSLPETFFLRVPSSWGWATWARAWRLFERDGRRLLQAIEQQRLQRVFDLDGSMAYTQMLRDQIKGLNDSWAIRWDASVFLSGKLALYPNRSLVLNIGFDGSGTHSGTSGAYDVELPAGRVEVATQPFVESSRARRALVQYYRRRNGVGRRILDRLGMLRWARRLLSEIRRA